MQYGLHKANTSHHNTGLMNRPSLYALLVHCFAGLFNTSFIYLQFIFFVLKSIMSVLSVRCAIRTSYVSLDYGNTVVLWRWRSFVLPLKPGCKHCMEHFPCRCEPSRKAQQKTVIPNIQLHEMIQQRRCNQMLTKHCLVDWLQQPQWRWLIVYKKKFTNSSVRQIWHCKI